MTVPQKNLARRQFPSFSIVFSASLAGRVTGGFAMRVAGKSAGIADANPRLSWQFQSTPSLRDETQSAYQIQVGSTAGAMDLWDSGKVAGSQTVDA